MGLFDVFKKKSKPSLEDTYMARDLSEIEEALLSGGMFPKTEDKEAYVYKLFFSPVEQGGFGLPIARKDEIMQGEIKKEITSSVFLGLYKKGKKLNNFLLEYARIFFGKGLKEPDYLVMSEALRIIRLCWAKIKQEDEVLAIERFYQELVSNPESFLYVQALYQGDEELVKYKMNFCFNVFYFDLYPNLKEHMTIEEVFTAPSIGYLRKREDEIEEIDV